MKDLYLIENAMTLVSKLTPEQIETVAKQSPDALQLVTPLENGGSRVDFTVVYDPKSDYGHLDNNGIRFPAANKDGNACVSVLIPANSKDKDGYIYDKYMVAINNLAVVEDQVVKALETVATTKKDFVAKITKLDAKTAMKETVDLTKKATPKASK